MKLQRIRYQDLNAKAKEMFNFHKASAKLADYGFTTMWLNNDWQGADFLAVHYDGQTFLKVQLKSRLSFSEKYRNKNLYICFICDQQDFYLYPHDEVLDLVEHKISDEKWKKEGIWSTPKLRGHFREVLKDYLICDDEG